MIGSYKYSDLPELLGDFFKSQFLFQAPGNKIEAAYPAADTEVYTYSTTTGTSLVLTVTYTDATKADILSVERTA